MTSYHKVTQHFQTHDPLIFSLIETHGVQKICKKPQLNNHFSSLCREIIGQQLSGKVVDVIVARFHALCGTSDPTPNTILALPDQTLCDVGMSWAKVRYVKNLAEHAIAKTIQFDALHTYDDERVIQELTKVKGIGYWTAEMFLMFTLGRANVFSFGDLGLKNAMKSLYGEKKVNTPKKIERIVQRWSPYKTYACLLLWKSLDA